MSATVISYAPGAGGNHLKNLLCIDKSFVNWQDLDKTVYQNMNSLGTVHSRPGRNVQRHVLNQALTTNDNYILHGHFGELGRNRHKINAIKNKKFIVVSMDDSMDQKLLDQRQEKLGHKEHEYYLTEEQPLLYQPMIYTTYFTGTAEDICVIPVKEFWHPVLETYNIIGRLNKFLNTNIDSAQAQELHTQWWNYNFGNSLLTRRYYGQTSLSS